MFDFRKVKYLISDKMRYDTPGDWYKNTIEVWSGLEHPDGVQFHELIECTILTAATKNAEKWVDILDGEDEEAKKLVPGWFKELYEKAHVIALLAEREYIEAKGLNWKEYDDAIENTRDKIPIRTII